MKQKTPMELLLDPIAVLKAEIEYTVGRKILTSKDCIDLSDAIWRKIENRISPNTLRRFFGLVKSEYDASLSTIDMLASYCGATSLDDLVSLRKQSTELAGEGGEALLKYLTILFESIQVSSACDPTFIKFTQRTIDFLSQNSELAYKFQRAVAKTKNGKRFYFEQFVNVDKLNSYYGNGLAYYLAENRSINAQIFGHSLLCLRYWLTMDIVKLEYHYEKLMGHTVLDEVNVFTQARYFAARLFYAEAKGLSTMTVIFEADEFYKNIRGWDKHNAQACFELVFSEALILTGYYEEAFVYTNEAYKRKVNNYGPGVDAELFKAMQLYHAIVLAQIGNEDKAAEIFGRLNPLEFYFISKQFQGILYTNLGMKLNKLRGASDQLDFLVGKTGFKRLLLEETKVA